MTEIYDAGSIKILKPEEAQSRFDWARVMALKEQYPTADERFIARGLEASRRSNTDPEYFIRRYLAHDDSLPRQLLLEETYREVQREEAQQEITLKPPNADKGKKRKKAALIPTTPPGATDTAATPLTYSYLDSIEDLV